MSKIIRPASPALILPERWMPQRVQQQQGHFNMGMIGGAAAVAASTWNPADKNASISLSNGNRTVAAVNSTGVYVGVRSVASKTSGKFYVEFVCATALNGTDFGIANSSYNLANLGTNSTTNISIVNNNGVTGTYGVAIDVTNKLAWYTNSTGTFTGNPAAGTGGTAWTFTGAVFLVCAPYDTGDARDTSTANFGNAAFAYSVPTGFTAGFG